MTLLGEMQTQGKKRGEARQCTRIWILTRSLDASCAQWSLRSTGLATSVINSVAFFLFFVTELLSFKPVLIWCRAERLQDARGKGSRSARVLQNIPTLCTSQHSDLNKINRYPKSRSSIYVQTFQCFTSCDFSNSIRDLYNRRWKDVAFLGNF